jgi:hypothetical protein
MKKRASSCGKLVRLLLATLGLHLGFAPLAGEHLPQLLGDRLVKNIGIDATQRFIAPRIRLGP